MKLIFIKRKNINIKLQEELKLKQTDNLSEKRLFNISQGHILSLYEYYF